MRKIYTWDVEFRVEIDVPDDEDAHEHFTDNRLWAELSTMDNFSEFDPDKIYVRNATPDDMKDIINC